MPDYIEATGDSCSIVIVNPNDRSWTRGRYILGFGAFSPTYLMVWANSLDGALDEAIDWIVQFAPGYLCDEQVTEEYQAALAEGLSEEDAIERAEEDTTCGGNCGNRIVSDEWCIVAENPTRKDILDMLAR